MALEQGLIQVYTGYGKGKTTAGLGLALPAAGNGLQVEIIQFMKGWTGYGELKGVDITRASAAARGSSSEEGNSHV